MGRRVFLSILGTGFYEKCRYQKDDFLGTETTFIQQNLVEYLQEKESWGHDDEIIMLLTDSAKKTNWNKDISTRFNTKLKIERPYLGLERIFMDMGVSYHPVHIEDGKDTNQMWSIFEVIFEQLQDDDRLYLDITNSFRYLPMLLLVLVNYAKLLKNVTVEAIFYGNYEAKNKENIAPIMDLLPLSSLQDWTAAASDYLQYGQVDKLHTLSELSLAPILRNPSTRTQDTELLQKFVNTLKKIIDERITCRGIKIVESKSVKFLEKKAKEIQNVTIVQLRPVFEKIKDSLTKFDTKANVGNCLKAAQWCFENKLYQQATTLLEEGLITVLCSSYQLDFKKQNCREIISSCIHIAADEIPEADWIIKGDKGKETINKILADESLWKNSQFLNALKAVVNLRNDYNHAGFRVGAMTSKKMINTIKIYMDYIGQFLKSKELITDDDTSNFP